MIGIKIADGTYIPVLDEFTQDKKKVILTTVKDDQSSVQIDVYRSADSGMENSQYLDSLRFDSIDEAPEGEPEIELVMNMADDGKLLAVVKDLKGSNEENFVIDLDNPKEPPVSAEDSDFGISSSVNETPSYSAMNGQSASIHEEKNRKPLLIVAILALLLAAGFLLWFFLLRDGCAADAAQKPAAPVVVAPPAPVPAQPAPAPVPAQAAPVPATPAPAPAQPAAPAAKPAAPAPKPAATAAKPAPQKPAKNSGTGVWYSIVKGDNLWNLSKSFYRTPWNYKKIANENQIRNPDLIYKGARIYIPDVETEKKK